MAKVFQLLPEIEKDFPKHRWVFLTLTVKNCPIAELRATIERMNKGFQLMRDRGRWPGVGAIKSIEVTRSEDGSAHPHFHVMVMVKPNYFNSPQYMRHDLWIAEWRRWMKLDYDPTVYVQAVERGQEHSAIPELLKYSTKSSDLTKSIEWFGEYVRQVDNLKFIAPLGELKKKLDSLTYDPEDYIGKSERMIPMTDVYCRSKWNDQTGEYDQTYTIGFDHCSKEQAVQRLLEESRVDNPFAGKD